MTSAHYLLADLYVGDDVNHDASTTSMSEVTSESDDMPSVESDFINDVSEQVENEDDARARGDAQVVTLITMWHVVQLRSVQL